MQLTKLEFIKLLIEQEGDNVNLEQLTKVYNKGIGKQEKTIPTHIDQMDEYISDRETRDIYDSEGVLRGIDLMGNPLTVSSLTDSHGYTLEKGEDLQSLDLFGNTKSLYDDTTDWNLPNNKSVLDEKLKEREEMNERFKDFNVERKRYTESLPYLSNSEKGLKPEIRTKEYAPYAVNLVNFKYYLRQHPELLVSKRIDWLASNMVAKFIENEKHRIGTFYNYYCALNGELNDIEIREIKRDSALARMSKTRKPKIDAREYLKTGADRVIELTKGTLPTDIPVKQLNILRLVDIIRRAGYRPEQCAYAILRSFRLAGCTRGTKQCKLYNKLTTSDTRFYAEFENIFATLVTVPVATKTIDYILEVKEIIEKSKNKTSSAIDMVNPTQIPRRRLARLNSDIFYMNRILPHYEKNPKSKEIIDDSIRRFCEYHNTQATIDNIKEVMDQTRLKLENHIKDLIQKNLY